MIIIMGLGNPGEKFKNTRHNVGFEAIDFFAKENEFGDFAMQKKYSSLISKKDDILLVKPQTFMNESGKAVKAILKNYKEALLVVVHDDIDLPLGKIKIVKDRGSAGHKGIESIIENVGNENVIRLRVGISKNEVKTKKAKDVVLEKFTNEEQNIVDSTIKKTAEALGIFIKEGLEKTMNEYNKPLVQ